MKAVDIVAKVIAGLFLLALSAAMVVAVAFLWGLGVGLAGLLV